MIKRLFDWLIQPLGLRVAGVLVLVLFGLAACAVPSSTPEQPIQFPHNKHIQNGLQCLFCHPSAARGPTAGIPTRNRCWGCHQQMEITNTSELLKPLKEAVANDTPIKWTPVFHVPDFVQFNHRAHVAAGQNCENCHGDFTDVTVPTPTKVFNMGFCLDCHTRIGKDDQAKMVKLTDCVTCHY